MIDQEITFKKFLVDTNIVIYTLKGVDKAVEAMEKFEDDEIEIYYSTIVESELFSFHQLTKDQRIKIRGILDLGEIIDVDEELLLSYANETGAEVFIYRLTKEHIFVTGSPMGELLVRHQERIDASGLAENSYSNSLKISSNTLLPNFYQ